MTLRAGDLIFTGTPSGVGVFRKPPIFLKVNVTGGVYLEYCRALADSAQGVHTKASTPPSSVFGTGR
jgi:2-keto-4-pentenoate hydratase/2-oxohepta-3-ene-1,7-dioic acid hydratase in catechol pathway